MKKFKILISILFKKNGYFHLIFLAHRMLFKKIISGLINISSIKISLLLMSINSVSKIKYNYDKNKKLFFVTEDNVKHFFSNAHRGNWLYQQGLFNRSFQLNKSYGINRIALNEDDIVIDIGANYGDLGVYLKKFKVKMYGFEPDLEAWNSLKENNYYKIFKIALSNYKGLSKFYISSSRADSSLFMKEPNQKYIETDTDMLDNFFHDKPKIKLIKIEAEGAEPEILKGSINILKKTEFLCVDGGPERGREKKQTIEEFVNIMLENNFKLLYLNTDKKKLSKALFVNKNFINI